MKRIYTLGHSNRSAEAFLKILDFYGIDTLIDIRSRPYSGRFPHFDRSPLENLLNEQDIQYPWMGNEFGGMRKPGPGDNTVNDGLEPGGFRNYADYMQGKDFLDAVEKLEDIISGSSSCLMCAEKDYTRCHRRFLSDFLYGRGLEVFTSLKWTKPRNTHPTLRPVSTTAE